MSNSSALLVCESPKAYHFQDQLWKTLITDLFEEFLLYFLPELYEHVDWSIPPEKLEQEFISLSPEQPGTRVADKLFKVQLTSGNEQWVLVHVEIQGDNREGFPTRMFETFYRALDQYHQKICAIALFTTNHTSDGQNKFQYDFYGTHLTYEYNTFNLIDMDEKDLWQLNNPIKFALLAGLFAHRAGNNVDKRFEMKKRLFELLLQEKVENPHNKIEMLLYFVDFLLEVPKELKQKLANQMRTIFKKEGIKVANFGEIGVSPTFEEFEEIMKKEGIKEGIREGIKEGIKEGQKEKQHEIALEMLKEGLDLTLIEKLTKLSKKEIKLLQEKLQ